MNTDKPPVSKAKLAALTPGQQEAIFAHCEKSTVSEALRWLDAEFQIKIGRDALGTWLQQRRWRRFPRTYGRKIRPDCTFGTLSPEQRRMVCAHCETVSLDQGIRWIKEEFGLTISSSALSRWLRRRRDDQAADHRLEEIRDDSRRAALIGKVFGAANTLAEANTVLVAQAVFEELRKPAAERDEKRLAQFMNLALKARTVGLAHHRFHFDAAKRATQCAAQLQKISQEAGGEREKIEKAMVVLFGEEPSGFQSMPDSPQSTPEGEA